MSDGYVALYRRYRPRHFSEVIGQEAAVESLTASLRSGRFAHAYLFCGPRGTGKTSLARLLARAVNCAQLEDGEPCETCPSCVDFLEGRLVDVHEIDAASNRRIAEMRDLLEQVTYTPTRSKYKVYILDEAHMLTVDAANAFLKTLEEPPPHVMFVLATTEAHKILPTISSRCQVYEFRKIGEDACATVLERVAGAEGVQLGEGVARFIALRSGGAMRDALALLERLVSSCGETIDREAAVRSLGLVPEGLLVDLVRALATRAPADAYRVLDEVTGQGRDTRRLLVDLVSMVRDLLRARCIGSPREGESGPLEAYAPATRDALEAVGQRLGEERILSILSRLDRGLVEARQALMPDFSVELTIMEALHLDVVYDREAVERRLAKLEESAEPKAPRDAIRAGATEEARSPARPVPSPEPRTEAAPPAVEAAAELEASEDGPVKPDEIPPVATEPGPPEAAPVAAPEAAIPDLDEAQGTSGEAASPPGKGPPGEEDLSGQDLSSAWRSILERAKREHPITAGFLREASLRAGPAGGVEVVLEAAFSFHHGKLQDPKHRGVLSSLLKDELGPETGYELVLEGGKAAAPARTRRRRPDPGRGDDEMPPPDREPRGPPRSGRGKDWYEDKVLDHKRVQEAVKTFDGEVISVD